MSDENINNSLNVIPSEISTTYDRNVSLPNDDEFSKPGYTFLGWSKNSAAIIPEYLGGSSYTYKNFTSIENDTVELYAVWQANTYTITFNRNIPEHCDRQPIITNEIKEQVFGNNYALPEISLVGYNFEGWYLGTELITKNTKIATPNNHTLVAKWTPYSYHVNFNANCYTNDQLNVIFGTDQIENSIIRTIELTVDDTTEITPENQHAIMNRVGHTLNNWNTKQDGTGTAYTSTSSLRNISFEDDITLYAQWTKNIIEPVITDLIFTRDDDIEEVINVSGNITTFNINSDTFSTYVENKYYGNDSTLISSKKSYIDNTWLIFTSTDTNNNGKYYTTYNSWTNTSSITTHEKYTQTAIGFTSQTDPQVISYISSGNTYKLGGYYFGDQQWASTNFNLTNFSISKHVANTGINPTYSSSISWDPYKFSGGNIFNIQLFCYCRSYVEDTEEILDIWEYKNPSFTNFISKAFYIMDISKNGHTIGFGEKITDEWAEYMILDNLSSHIGEYLTTAYPNIDKFYKLENNKYKKVTDAATTLITSGIDYYRYNTDFSNIKMYIKGYIYDVIIDCGEWS